MIIAGIIGISVMTCVALYSGVDGVLFGSAIAGIASLVGYAFGVRSQKKIIEN